MYNQTSLLNCLEFETFEVIRGDCRDEQLVSELIKDADVVIPLAARTINVEAVRSICKLLSPSQQLLFPVTNSGYGIGEKGIFCTEDSPLRPISLYGQTKVEAEKVVLERENSISFRLATTFGISPRMRLDLLVNDFVWRAVTDRSVTIFEGHFKRNYIHVRDVAGVFLHGIQNMESMRGRPYNVGLEDTNISKLELCAEIQKVVPSFVFLEAPIGEDPDKRDYIVSNQRILQTGFQPQWSLQDGIRELVKGCRILRNNTYSNV